MSSQQVLLTKHQQQLKALCALSNMAEPLDWQYLNSLVSDSPDPETAVQGVLDRIPPSSDVLTTKWRTIITDMWSLQHPHVPLLSELPLSTKSAHHSAVLQDAQAYIKELSEEPAALIEEKNEWLVDADHALRIAKSLPSMKITPLAALESEWGIMPLRRLRAMLHSTRLVRPLKGRLVPVQSRITRFNALPAKHQLFILWHADVYHIDWSDFAGLWSPYAHVVQDYLPLLWETVAGATADQIEDRATFAGMILETFTPLWDDEGLLDIRPGHTAALNIVQQHALPTIIDRFILRDLFERHGLVTISEEFGSISKFTWTKIGETMVHAEHRQHLPCGNDLLNS